MSDISKKPYELSLWKDKLYFLLLDKTSHAWSLSDEIKSNNDVKNDFFKEVKLGVFGGDSMDSPIRAFDVKLTQNVNGSNELSFSIYYKYWDCEKNELVDNPWKTLLTNESKVKLYYDGRYFDFIIKKTSEDTSKYIYTYTGTDLFIEDLSKNGYNIELNDTLMNNTGTISELANEVLASSEWKLSANQEVIKERSKQSLFIYSTTEQTGTITGTNVEDSTKTITVPINSKVYFFYSDTIDTTITNPYFLYDPTGQYKTDSNGILINLPNYTCTRPAGLNANSCGIANVKGERLISQLKSQYVPVLGQTCYEYKRSDVDYYEYSSPIYTSGAQLANLIGNNTSFVTTDGWSCLDSGVSLSIERSDNINKLRINASGNYTVRNSGLFNLRQYIPNGFIPGDKYELLIKCDGNINDALIEIGYNNDEKSSTTLTIESDLISPSLVLNYINYQFTIHDDDELSKTNLINAFSAYLILKGIGTTYIKEILLFKHIEDSAGNLVIPKIENVETAAVLLVHYFAKKDKILSLVNADDLHYDYIEYGDISNNWTPIYEADFAKKTSITAEKSNRFNIIQSLAEAFQCWVKFTIGHNNTYNNGLYPGSILYNYQPTSDIYYISGKRYYVSSGSGIEYLDAQWMFANIDEFFTLVGTSTFDNTKYYYEKNIESKDYYLLNINELEYTEIADKSKIYYLSWSKSSVYEKNYQKYISFHTYIGLDNYTGFKYGLNLQGIKRDINTESIVTKLIVQTNNNEFADSGIGQCSIATSKFNETRENFIINLDYYVKQGLLDESTLLRDLYNDSDTEGIGYIKKLGILNANNEYLINEQSQLNIDYIINNANYQTAVLSVYAANTEMDKYEQYIKTNDTSALKSGDYYLEKEGYNDQMNQWIQLYNILVNNKKVNEQLQSTYTTNLLNISKKLVTIAKELNVISSSKQGLNETFNTKYSRYLREGTWINEDYMNADKYYTDAQNVLYNSAYPQVSYTINVADIGVLEDYDIYQFKIADETYVEDIEFFGIDKETKKPIQERVVVTQLISNLNNPSKNSITVKNYDNRWESLFQKITAQVQSLQFHEGEYKKVSDTIESDGTIKSDYLKNAFAQNQVLANALNDEIAAGNGIELTNASYPEKQIRIGSNGITIKNNDTDGWTTAISADGINASKINTGLLNTEKIRIFGGSNANFVWDKDNLTAYAHDDDIISDTKYVRFNQSGIQGILNGNTVTPIFSLGYEGFKLNAINGSNYVRIASEPVNDKVIYAGDNTGDKFIVYKDGTILANNGTFKGTIKATAGYFGGVAIENNAMVIYANSTAREAKSGNYITVNNEGIVLTNNGNNCLTADSNGIKLLKGSNELNLTSSGIELKQNTNKLNLTSSGIKLSSGSHWIDITSTGITFDQEEDITTTMDELYSISLITSTTINTAYIKTPLLESPLIYGDRIIARGTSPGHSGTFLIMKLKEEGETEDTLRGYMGYMKGSNGVKFTDGIGISTGDPAELANAPLIIVTTEGVRITSFTKEGVMGGVGSWGGKAYFNQGSGDTTEGWKEIGSGTAIFG